MTQREIQSDPNIPDPNSPDRGPGFVAAGRQEGALPAPRHVHAAGGPVPDRAHQPRQHRQPRARPHPRHRRRHRAAQPVQRRPRVHPARQEPPAARVLWLPLRPAPLGAVARHRHAAGRDPALQERNQLVGGIGVFFPGTTGFATEENSDLNDAGFYDPTKPDQSLEAEYIAFVAAGGSKGAGVSFNTPAMNEQLGLPPFPDGEKFDLPFGRIDLVGITLDIFGAHGAPGPPEPRRPRPDARPGRPQQRRRTCQSTVRARP